MNSRKFTLQNVLQFAELSGDYNPIHTDVIASRRMLFGSPVVHGIYSLLWALDYCLEDATDNLRLTYIKAIFPEPIKIDEVVSLSFESIDGRVNIKLVSGSSIKAIIAFAFEKFETKKLFHVSNCDPKKYEPLLLSDNEIETSAGCLDLYLNNQRLTQMFPWLAKCIDPSQIAVILCTSRLIGSICPGLNSLYSEIELCTIGSNQKTKMDYEVSKYNKKFSQVSMKIIAPDMTGRIKAFVRPEPKKQASCLSLRSKIKSNEFFGQRALIIGGSRGLGEITAKILCCGGADVKFTYHYGHEDAKRVVDDIISAGGIVDNFHFDVLTQSIDLKSEINNSWKPTHLYYFATPFIFPGVNGEFSPKLFNHFCNYYVAGLANVVTQLSVLGLNYIFYPSSVFLDRAASNLGEYSAAKSASETYCSFVEKTHRETIIHRPRLPRMSTDQSASIMPIVNQDPVPIMIKEIRSFRERTNNN